ncbi:cytochrome P450 [Streptomyces sp. MNU89]|uniref:cytochrome P450 n=1 Tax=Streptomyces sp. MNU89 TaxID=2560025 RepID=UPI001E3B21E3|nr:cytochrome P450 [Streptomyces sp. MNU89]MCC9742780.1 cytochrome P450 [Streptomyces sp. MNU89]
MTDRRPSAHDRAGVTMPPSPAPEPAVSAGPRKAGTAEQVRFTTEVLLPLLSVGVIKRRPRVMALAERLQLDRGGVATVRLLRERHGAGPLLMRLAGRSVLLLLDPGDVRRVLDGTPRPFGPASWEKRGALTQFQPHGSLITRGTERAPRRRLNEEALETDRPLHHLAPTVAGTVGEEARLLADRCAVTGQLAWDDFAAYWWRTVRRTVLGDAARDDHRLTEELGRLREAANWSVLLPRRRALRARFLEHLRRRAEGAGPDTLAAAAMARAEETGADPVSQIAHWLFAFDAAGMTVFRTLALLTTHPEDGRRARDEIGGTGPGTPRTLPFLRACVLDTVRLWPTTPAVLRQTTEDIEWDGRTVPARTTVLAYAPYFHRGDPHAPYADRFTPGMWLDGRARSDPALVPFSGGPGVCPGENIVLLHTSTWLAAMLGERLTYRLASRVRPSPCRPLPATFNPFGVRFTVH